MGKAMFEIGFEFHDNIIHIVISFSFLYFFLCPVKAKKRNKLTIPEGRNY